MDDLEWIELQSVFDLFGSCLPEVAEPLDLAVLDLDAAGAFSIGAYPELLLFNRVLGLDDGERLSEVERWFASRGCRFVISTSPGSPLEPRLKDRGYRIRETFVKFRRGVSAPEEAPTPLRGRAARRLACRDVRRSARRSLRNAPTSGSLVRRALRTTRVGMLRRVRRRPLRQHGARARRRGKLAWLGAAVTRPEARGRGGQSALLAIRIRWAAAAGAATLTLETREHEEGEAGASFRNVLRAGFEEAYRQRWWVRP